MRISKAVSPSHLRKINKLLKCTIAVVQAQRGLHSVKQPFCHPILAMYFGDDWLEMGRMIIRAERFMVGMIWLRIAPRNLQY